MVGDAQTGTVAGVRISTVIVGGVPARGSGGQVRVRAHTGSTYVVGTVITVIGASRAIGFMVVLARTRPVASVRIGTVIVGGVPARGSGGQVRVRARAGSTYVVGTVITVIGASRAIGFIVLLARTRPVAGVGIGTVVVR
jgi:hypothetical protein